MEATMPRYTNAYSGFSTNDIAATRRFYAETLGLEVSEANGMLTLHLPGGATALVYPKDDHRPATYTCLNLAVGDIDAAVDELAGRGVTFERYDGMGQDDRGVMRDQGPPIAWFTDPAGNIVSVIEEAGAGS
jgi:catechol 2,3-dioxygenase-like lactoylglutathione lyase family enzyme